MEEKQNGYSFSVREVQKKIRKVYATWMDASKKDDSHWLRHVAVVIRSVRVACTFYTYISLFLFLSSTLKYIFISF